MRTTLSWLVIASGLAFLGCDRQPRTAVEFAPPEEVATPAPHTVAPPPVPVRLVVTATPAPSPAVPKRTPALAPPGVYFLVAATSAETSDGIVGLRPGTRVLKQPDGRYFAEGNLITLRSDQVTNDLEYARRIAETEALAQLAIRQSMQAVAAAELALQSGESFTATSAPEASQATPAPRNTVTGPTRGLDAASLNGSGEIGRRSKDNRGRVFFDSTGRRYWRGPNGETRYDF